MKHRAMSTAIFVLAVVLVYWEVFRAWVDREPRPDRRLCRHGYMARYCDQGCSEIRVERP